jgi:hypothetical protein
MNEIDNKVKAIVEVIKEGFTNKGDIVRATGIDIHVLNTVWIRDEIQEALAEVNDKTLALMNEKIIYSVKDDIDWYELQHD